MYEQHERCYTLIVRAVNLRGEHERLGNGENKYLFCMSYHLSLALIESSSAATYGMWASRHFAEDLPPRTRDNSA